MDEPGRDTQPETDENRGDDSKRTIDLVVIVQI
jgi:hypothetical protein